MAAAVLLAYVPRLPSPHGSATGLGLTSRQRCGSRRAPTAACGSSRRRRSRRRSCCWPARACCSRRSSRCRRRTTGYDMRQVLAVDVPVVVRRGLGERRPSTFYQEAMRRISELPGVERVAVGSFVPWRDAGSFGPGFQFTVEGYTPGGRRGGPARAVPHRLAWLLRGARRADRRRPRLHRRRPPRRASPWSIVSQSVAQRLFPNGDALNRHLRWTDPVMQSSMGSQATAPHRRRGRRRRRRERRAGTGADRLPPASSR